MNKGTIRVTALISFISAPALLVACRYSESDLLVGSLFVLFVVSYITFRILQFLSFLASKPVREGGE